MCRHPTMQHAPDQNGKQQVQTPVNTPQLAACSSPVEDIDVDILRLPPIVEENYDSLCRSIAAKGPPKLTRQRNTLVDVIHNLEQQGFNIYGNSFRYASMRDPSDAIIEGNGRSHSVQSAASTHGSNSM